MSKYSLKTSEKIQENMRVPGTKILRTTSLEDFIIKEKKLRHGEF